MFSCNSCYSWPSLQAAPRGLEAGQPQALPRQIAVRGVHKRHRVSRVEDPKVFFLREGFQIRAARPLPVLAVAMPIRFKVVAEIEQLRIVRIFRLRLDAFAFLVTIGNGRQVNPRIGAQQMPCLIVRLDLQNLVFPCRLVPLVVNLHHTLKPDSLKILDAETSEVSVVKRLAACQIAGTWRVRPNLPGQKRTQADRMLVEVRSEEHTSELQSLTKLVCRLLLDKKQYVERFQREARTSAKLEHPTIIPIYRVRPSGRGT